MRKDAPYLKHDANASYNPKLMALLRVEKVRGYGVYWLLLETLRLQPGFRMAMTGIGVLARRYGTHTCVMLRIINNYGLFTVKDGYFSSSGLDRRLEAFGKYLNDTLPEKWSVVLDNSLEINNERYIHARIPDQTIPDQKNNTLKRGGVSRVLSMDESVALLPSEQIWCEDMARESGRGVGFTEDLPSLLPKFVSFLRLRGEEHTVCGLSDAKRRFLYWMKSDEGKRAISDLNRPAAGTAAATYRYETLLDGRRSYMGRLIPPDAPPRPDALSVWDSQNGTWTR
ncbi:DUF7833 domain-containing protein [Bacteroides sp.]